MVKLNVLPRFNEWKKKWLSDSELNVWNYIGSEVHPEDALMMSLLYFPNFVNTSGYYVREDQALSPSFKDYLKNPILSREEAEKSFNRLVLWDVFYLAQDVDLRVYECLGETLSSSWRCQLEKLFPEKNFIVMYSNTDTDYGPTITTWCNRSEE